MVNDLRLKISAISFLNTAPLMWDFDHDAGASSPLRKDFEIHYTVPSACAEALRAGTADIGIIPAITYQTIPDLVVIPDVAIGAEGPVRSILLVSKLPLDKIKTVAADTSSRTSGRGSPASRHTCLSSRTPVLRPLSSPTCSAQPSGPRQAALLG